MLYNKHKIWRDTFGIGTSWQDIPREYNFTEHLRRLRRSHPRIPYTLQIEVTTYWGNFEREFLGYCIGILDDVQMSINHSYEERVLFWKQEFNKDPIKFEDALENYELLRDYLFETFNACDDWEQLTFYNIDWDKLHKENRNVLNVQLCKPLSDDWEKLIIPRMHKFFIDRPYEYLNKDAQLVGIKLLNSKKEVIKEYK